MVEVGKAWADAARERRRLDAECAAGKAAAARGYGARLRKERARSGVTGAALAKETGVSPSFVSDVELGRRFPSEARAGKLAAALDALRVAAKGE